MFIFIIFYFLMYFTCSTGAPISSFYDTSSFSEPTFSVFLPNNNRRSFVGIRTLRPSKAVFGFRKLRESLAEQAEQRRELRKTRELEEKQNKEEIQQLILNNEQQQQQKQLLLLQKQQQKNIKQRQTRKTKNLKRRQQIYERLLCISTLQNLAKCRRNN